VRRTPSIPGGSGGLLRLVTSARTGPPLARFIAANKRLSKATEDWLPAVFKQHIQTLYKYKAAELINREPGQVVFDIGGGKECPFLPYLNASGGHLIIALDLSEGELRRNRQLEDKVVADAAAHGFPFRDGSADLVTSRSVVEHIRDNAAFFANCARVLRPGGFMIHAFPGKYAPFALINKLLPNRLARHLVGNLHPEWREEDNYGFLAFYDRCYFSAVRDLLDGNGFENLRFDFLYYQSIYFNFFYPLYLLMLTYDLIASLLGVRNLASGIVVTAERSPDKPGRAAVPKGCYDPGGTR
jgi:SAM-dependent methyltransferase